MLVRVVTDAHDNYMYLHSLSCWDVYMILSVIQALASTCMISIFLVEYMIRVAFGASNLASPFFTPGVFLFSISILFVTYMTHRLHGCIFQVYKCVAIFIVVSYIAKYVYVEL